MTAGPPATRAGVAERRLVQVRLPVPLVRRIDHLSVDLELTRQATVERLLEEALLVREMAAP